MRKQIATLWLIGLMALGWAVFVVAQEIPTPVRILVVDETKTFLSTMRVAGLVGGLRQIPLFEVEVRLADVDSSWDDPFAAEGLPEGATPYDVIVIIPRGVDDASIPWIWVVTGWIDTLAPQVRSGLEAISQILNQVFAGVGEAIDVSEDLWPGLLAAAYSAKGWIR
jgi:hypothetical protein